jgi:hypothetical protein
VSFLCVIFFLVDFVFIFDLLGSFRMLLSRVCLSEVSAHEKSLDFGDGWAIG